ncbi:MAG: radical SAM protein [Deltaproteobacteria bacterium]|nr:radical SAM protein [Deltaproteobacteria bacterium]
MNPGGFQHIYGPVPSRRLGRSLGVDLVPLKTCSYDCVYCQLGRTTRKTVERGEYVPVAEVLEELGRKLADGDSPDTISLAGSGEPTLNSGIGALIRGIKERTAIPVAVLTNGSLLRMDEVREDLMPADLVLPSLDAGDETLFRYVNRPHKDISFERMVDGIAAFAGSFPGEVWLEVFLLAGVTGLPSEAKRIADAARRIAPARLQLNTVSRPPVEEYACAVSGKRLDALKGIFPGIVDVLNESGGEDFRTSLLSGVREEDILGLLGRRPCTFQDVAGGLGIHATEAIKGLDALAAAGKVKSVLAGGRTFYSIAERKGAPGT